MKFYLSMAALAGVVHANVGLMIPFYEYPSGDAATADWAALVEAVDTYPELDFYVIIDNNNGAPYSSNPPDAIVDWAQWLDSLNSAANVKTIGYIRTTQSTRDTAEVEEGVNQYANWTTNQGWSGGSIDYDIHIDGVFFDEIDTDPTKLDYNIAITQYAKSVFASQGGPVVLNPGVLVQSGSESLFDVADAIVDIETCYTTVEGATDPGSTSLRCPTGAYTPFTPEMLNTLPCNKTRLAKSSVIIHDFYESWSPYEAASLETLETDISAIISRGVHSFYITQFAYTGNFTTGPANISTVASLAAQAQGLKRRDSRLR